VAAAALAGAGHNALAVSRGGGAPTDNFVATCA
jgi:hypothetical protein